LLHSPLALARPTGTELVTGVVVAACSLSSAPLWKSWIFVPGTCVITTWYQVFSARFATLDLCCIPPAVSPYE
jgi:hypothetical protein